MRIKDIDLFATAVVQSSSSDLTVQEKLDLYVEAKKTAKEHNDSITKEKSHAKVSKD